ncbi:MraY family glycosyltransferase [Thiocystis violacea]|uniref:MraY family glycosyltransferase n=1 Tax=Thiocystis violacea TaxID=13725 RepID=UPI001903AEE9|nr:MraY family glycosyltransferase [Thiocystis violacea]
MVFVPLDQEVSAFLAAAAILFLFGLLDDRFNLDYRLKLLGQVIAALVVVVEGGVSIQELPFLDVWSLPAAISIPLTLLFLVGITNAVNLSDGLDGLAGGISVLGLGCLAAFAYQNGDRAAFSIAIAMIGATFGFLRYNSNPAQIFMGDSGSQFLGFGTGVLAIRITQSPDSALGVLVPLLILGIPILDTLSVMVKRVAAGRSPFSADRLHLHHRLLSLGLTQSQAVTLVYLAQLVAVALAYVMRYSADAAVLSVYLVFCAIVLLGLHALGTRQAAALGRDPRLRSPSHTRLLMLIETHSKRVLTSSHRALSALVSVVLVIGAFLSADVSLDVAEMAFGLLVLSLLTTFVTPIAGATIERVVLYATCVMVVSLATPHAEALVGTNVLTAVFAAVALLTGVWLRTTDTDFRANSLDMLILIVAVSVPLLSEALAQNIGFLVLESVVLFYAVEVILAKDHHRWGLLRTGTLIALGILAMKGFKAL